MRILFTKSNLIGSKVIRWGLGEPVSHVAFLFDEKLVIHSSIQGVELAWFNEFKKRNTIVFDLHYELGLEQEESVYRGILDSYDGNGYDYGAYFYFAICAARKKCFSVPLPSRNAWGSKGAFLCTEMVNTLPSWLVSLKREDYGIVSPYSVYLELNAQLSGGGNT